MAQPNVQREPSMDEILASIRRIIESNEPVIQANIANVMSEPEGFSGHAANDDGEEVPLTVDGSFGEIKSADEAAHERPYDAEEHVQGFDQPPQATAPVVGPGQANKNLSLADVAARVRAASERSAPSRGGAYPQESMPARVPVAQPEDSYPSIEATPLRMEAARTLGGSTEASISAVAERAPVSETALLSSSSGEQVARSFQDLAFAVETAQRRSFDEIAADILRPMLQEWLDDNLPTLVERLVREEIERVARGPRRG